MDLTEKKIENKVQFWTVLGPFVLIMTLFISLIKASPETFYLPLAALLGIPLCWRWKTRGLIISTAFLLVFFAIFFVKIPVEERFWQAGIALATILGFVVTALSFEEVSATLQTLQIESSSRLDNLLVFDERIKKLQEEAQKERDDLTLKLKQITKESEERLEQNLASEKLVAVMRDEVEQVHLQKEQALEELREKRRESVELKQSLEELQNHSNVIQGLKQRNQEIFEEQKNKEALFRNGQQELEQLNQELAAKNMLVGQQRVAIGSLGTTVEENAQKIRDQEKRFLDQEAVTTRLHEENRALQARMSVMEEELQTAREGVQEGHNRLDLLNAARVEKFQLELGQKELQLRVERLLKQKKQEGDPETEAALRTQLREAQGQIDNLFAEWDNANKKLEELKGQSEQLKIMPTLLEQQAIYRQLREQFEEKSEVLHQARKQIYELEGKLQALHREKELRALQPNSNEVILEKTLFESEEARRQAESAVIALEDLVANLIKG